MEQDMAQLFDFLQSFTTSQISLIACISICQTISIEFHAKQEPIYHTTLCVFSKKITFHSKLNKWYGDIWEREGYNLNIPWWRHQIEQFFALPGHRWTPLTEASEAELWWFSYDRFLNKHLSKQLKPDDLRRHRADYDVIVMRLFF